jgi:hypothetical protein
MIIIDVITSLVLLLLLGGSWMYLEDRSTKDDDYFLLRLGVVFLFSLSLIYGIFCIYQRHLNVHPSNVITIQDCKDLRK